MSDMLNDPDRIHHITKRPRSPKLEYFGTTILLSTMLFIPNKASAKRKICDARSFFSSPRNGNPLNAVKGMKNKMA